MNLLRGVRKILGDEREHGTVISLESSAAEWDSLLLASGGHDLQSWKWGEFRRRQGWLVYRLISHNIEGTALAQVNIRSVWHDRLPLKIACVQRGPIIPIPGSMPRDFTTSLHELCIDQGVGLTVIEPEVNNDVLPNALT